MNEEFSLPVTYKGEEWHFPAQLVQLGYTHRFKVLVNETEVFFEPDEEQAYRAIVDTETINREKFSTELLQAIAKAIEDVLK